MEGFAGKRRVTLGYEHTTVGARVWPLRDDQRQIDFLLMGTEANRQVRPYGLHLPYRSVDLEVL